MGLNLGHSETCAGAVQCSPLRPVVRQHMQPSETSGHHNVPGPMGGIALKGSMTPVVELHRAAQRGTWWRCIIGLNKACGRAVRWDRSGL